MTVNEMDPSLGNNMSQIPGQPRQLAMLKMHDNALRFCVAR